MSTITATLGGRVRRGAAERLSRVSALWALTWALVGVAVVLLVGPVRGLADIPTPVDVMWPAFIPLFCLVEWWRVYVHFRKNAHSFSLSEVPLVLGFFLMPAPGLVLARAVGAAVALGLVRRQPRVKLVFNLAVFSIEAEVGLLLIRALLGTQAPTGAGAWACVLLTTILLSLVGLVLILFAITLSEGRPDRAEVSRTLAFVILGAACNTCLGLEGLSILWRNASEIWLLVVPVGMLALAYRAYTLERQRHQRMRFLYQSSDLLQRSVRDVDSVPALLRQVVQVFRADVAEIIRVAGVGGTTVERVTVRGGALVRSGSDNALRHDVLTQIAPDASAHLIRRGAPSAELGALLGIDELHDAMVVGLRGDGGTLGVMLVGNRLGDVSGFTQDDLELFEALAAQASVSIDNGRLGDELKHQAFHDPLTGLANRALFSDRIAHALVRTRPGRRPNVAVLFIDLDDFKTVNDSLGHSAGDALLCDVAARITGTLRPYDTAARLGGDEFAILLEDAVDPGPAVAVAERVVASLRDHFEIGHHRVAMHASIGIAIAERGDTDASDLLRRADVAMYRVKQHGKGAFQIYDPSMQHAVTERLELKTQLEGAVTRQEVIVEYQPIVELQGGHLRGFEALVRWDHPVRGVVPPDQFVGLAEETGLIVQIGRHVLQEAARRLREWDQMGATALTMSVNLSPRQLEDPGLIADVREAVLGSGVAPSRITLEITESVMVAEELALRLWDLKALGIRLAIDDFGTGYSSLSRLGDLPVDILKLAKPFVDGVADDARQRAYAEAILGLGRTLRLTMVAEGVERVEQWTKLRELGCELGQGYHFGRPVTADLAALQVLSSLGGEDLGGADPRAAGRLRVLA